MMSDMLFWFHYNKSLSREAQKPQISLHFKKQCTIVDNIECHVPTFGKINSDQPYWVMRGRASSIELVNGIAIIR